LDVGCGGGSFLVAAKQAGYDCRGVEYDVSTIEQAAERTGLPVSTLEQVEEDRQLFDVIHMLDVLPHLTDPAGMMRRLQRLLAPDGLFFVEGPLENNASLVRFLATTSKRLRRGLGIDRAASIAPTMLMRLNSSAQREFFTGRLGYGECYFEVYETGWPYFVSDRAIDSLAVGLKQAIGALAIVVSRIERGPVRTLGNRFYGIYRPTRRG
jgi:SAM-dependent methyltransferase